MKILKFLLVAAALPLSSFATSIVLYNTGVDSLGVPLASPGSTDPHYTVTSDNNGTPAAAVTFNCCYFSDGPNSDWISVNDTGSDGSVFYDFQTTFLIPVGFDPTTASISGLFAADNHVTATKINGTTVVGATTDTFDFYTPFSIISGFVSGVNTLDFIVKDDGPPSSLRVDSLTGSVSPSSGAPEPASISLLAGGVVLLGLGRRAARKSRA